MNKVIKDQTFEEERSLYNLKNIEVSKCIFAGEKDGESPLKECENVIVKNCDFSLRYALWHTNLLQVEKSRFSNLCRAPFWYNKVIDFKECTIESVKCFRESNVININSCTINSDEPFVRCNSININNSFMSGNNGFNNCKDVVISNSKYEGKYSFQYCKNVSINNSTLDIKDAFWHSNNVVIKNCNITGSYIGWYSNNLILIDCTIESIQPFCYCKNLKLINCRLNNCNDAFEYSDVKAQFMGENVTIKNPLKGLIEYSGNARIINSDSKYKCRCKIVKI